jgi:hypothetical protein
MLSQRTPQVALCLGFPLMCSAVHLPCCLLWEWERTMPARHAYSSSIRNSGRGACAAGWSAGCRTGAGCVGGVLNGWRGLGWCGAAACTGESRACTGHPLSHFPASMLCLDCGGCVPCLVQVVWDHGSSAACHQLPLGSPRLWRLPGLGFLVQHTFLTIVVALEHSWRHAFVL